MDHRKITNFGWEIKKRLSEQKIDQQEFCRIHNIPPSRLSNIIYGRRKAKRYRQKISQLLNIDDVFEDN